MSSKQPPVEILNGQVQQALPPFVPGVYCLRLQCPESLGVTSSVLEKLLDALKSDTGAHLDNIQWTVSANITHDDPPKLKKAKKTLRLEQNGSVPNGHASNGVSTSSDSDNEPDTIPEMELAAPLPRYFCKTVPAKAPREDQKVGSPTDKSVLVVTQPTETILVEMWYKDHRGSDTANANRVAEAVRGHISNTLNPSGDGYNVYLLKYNLVNATM